MNRIASTEKSFANRPVSSALRCANAIDEIEPNEDWWDDDEITRMVEFDGMIGTDPMSYGND